MQPPWRYLSECDDRPLRPFAIGQTLCLPLTAVGDGVPFQRAGACDLGGIPVTCVPSDIPRSAALPIGITYNASGTTLNVHCDAHRRHPRGGAQAQAQAVVSLRA